jgi:hypothetical protein
MESNVEPYGNSTGVVVAVAVPVAGVLVDVKEAAPVGVEVSVAVWVNVAVFDGV